MAFNIVNAKISFNRADFKKEPEELKPVEDYLRKNYSFDDEASGADYSAHIHFRYILHSLDNREERIVVILSRIEPGQSQHEQALANIFGEKTKEVKRIDLSMAEIIGQEKWRTLQLLHSNLHPDILVVYGAYKHIPVADYQSSLMGAAKNIEDVLFENGLENMMAEKTDGESLASRLLDMFINYREISSEKDYVAAMGNTAPDKSFH